MLRHLAASLLALAVLPGAAPAATVTASFGGSRGNEGLGVVLQGGASAEHLRIDGAVAEDLEEPLTIAAGSASWCTQLDEHHVRCSPASYVAIDGGAGDDTIAFAGPPGLSGPSVSLTGGDGNDTITGGAGHDNLDGGPGDDVLDGGDGPDFLDGGPGADVIRGGAGDDSVSERTADGAAGDRIDGGSGTDGLTVDADPVAPATLDVALTSIAGGATASFTGFESYGGSLQPDAVTLLGSDGPDTLAGAGTIDGRGGDDHLSGPRVGGRLAGGEGDDVLDGGTGAVLDGGPGDDVLSGAARSLACGPGSDRVIAPGRTLVPAECEQAVHDVLRGAGRSLGSFGHPRPGRAQLSLPVAGDRHVEGCGVVVRALSGWTGRALTRPVQIRAAAWRRTTRLHLPLLRPGTKMKDIVLSLTPVRSCAAARWSTAGARPQGLRLATV